MSTNTKFKGLQRQGLLQFALQPFLFHILPARRIPIRTAFHKNSSLKTPEGCPPPPFTPCIDVCGGVWLTYTRPVRGLVSVDDRSYPVALCARAPGSDTAKTQQTVPQYRYTGGTVYR